jgi:hypothetical protein
VPEAAYHAASGLSAQPFLPRWLAVTAVLFAISAATLAVRVAMVHQRRFHRGRVFSGRIHRGPVHGGAERGAP